MFDIVANGRNGIDVDKYAIISFYNNCVYLCFSKERKPNAVLIVELGKRFDYIGRDTRACGLGCNFHFRRYDFHFIFVLKTFCSSDTSPIKGSVIECDETTHLNFQLEHASHRGNFKEVRRRGERDLKERVARGRGS